MHTIFVSACFFAMPLFLLTFVVTCFHPAALLVRMHGQFSGDSLVAFAGAIIADCENK